MLHARRVRPFFLLLVLCTLTSVPVFGQAATATLSGVIDDPHGAVVPNVEVTATRIETSTVLTTKTNGAGIYFFTGLLPGHYHLMIQKTGFKEIAIKEFELHVQDKLEQNFSLEIGSVSETVTVTANDLNVNTTDASVSTVIDRSFVQSLPLNGRSFNTLLQLTPGVVIAPSNQDSPGQFSIAGQRTDANNFTVDGVSANFGASSTYVSRGTGTGTAQAFSALGGTSSLVSVEALQEFRIETSSFAPEFGRSPGGQVILTTRSGTNDFHGGIYEYFRNTVMDANNWFNDAAIPPIPRAPEHNNDFGGYLGGPILKNKTFFVVSYEGARLTLPTTEVIQVPSTFARTQAPATLAPFLNAYPQPNGQPTAPDAYSAPFTGSFSNGANLDAGSARIDHTLNDRFSVFGRFNYAPSVVTERNVTIPNNPEAVTANTLTLTGGMNILLSTQVSNIFRANYSTQRSQSSFTLDSLGGAVPISPDLLLGNLPTASSFGVFLPLDIFTSYFIGAEASNRTKQLNFVDDVSWSLGTHQLKFGADYRVIYLDSNPYQQGVEYLPSSVQDFISTGQVTLEGQTGKRAQLLTRAFSLYAQDAWRVSPRLSLTYGLRWELSPATSPRGTTTLAAWTNVDSPATLALAPAGAPLWKTTYGNFAPRLGVAYRLTRNGDFVIRAGGGIFYDLGVGEAAQLGTIFPNFASGFAFGVPVPLTDATQYLPPLSSQPPFPFSGVEGYSPNLKLPRSYQWNVALEKSFGRSQAISATYVGQAGRDLLRQEALFQPNPNFSGEFLLWQGNSFSNYNALQLQYRRPLSSHVQALLNYTWSHSLDNASNDVIAGLSDTIISAANDYASSDFDVRQSFSGAIRFEIPSASKHEALSLVTKGWSVDTVIVVRTGFPFNATLRSFSIDPGGSALSRPDLNPGQPLYLYGSDCTTTFQSLNVLAIGQSCPGGKGLNPSAFSIPATIRQGTEGRNDIPGFGLTQVDLSIGRTFPIAERLNLQFRADAFNLFNHPNFTNPPGLLTGGPSYLLSGQMLNSGLGGLNPLFQEGGPRSLQLSLKLNF